MARRWRLRRYECETEGYSIVNDIGLGGSLLTYYISPRHQIAQLERCGFHLEGMFDIRGERTADEDRSLWVHYLARKAKTTSALGIARKVSEE